MTKYQVRITALPFMPGRESHRYVEVEVDQTKSPFFPGRMAPHQGKPGEPTPKDIWLADCGRMACEAAAPGLDPRLDERCSGWNSETDDVQVPAGTLQAALARVSELEKELEARTRIAELEKALLAPH